MKQWAFLLGAAMLAGCASKSTEFSQSSGFADPDVRMKLDSDGFNKVGNGEWVSSTARPKFPFDELIYSWDTSVADSEGFRLFLQVDFPGGEQSPWLYAGYWGDVELEESRETPSFERGRVAWDQLLLEEKAESFRFKVVSAGDRMLSTMPELYAIATDNEQYTYSLTPEWPIKETYVLDLPHRKQADSQGNPRLDHCQTAALATALEYYGQPVPLEDLIPWTYDPEYDLKGIWPRTLGAATQLGYDAYIDRFRNWERVERVLRDNKVILISMTMPEEGDYIAPPYGSTGGHIIALNGLTDDGRVITTDSALPPETGAMCQWLYQDMEKVWFENKGGVAMVIAPPEGAPIRTVNSIAEFPGDRREGK